MITHTWEDRALGVTLVLALVFGVALYAVRTTSLTSQAIAAEAPAADYMMTVTAHRLPAQCKGIAAERMSAMCRAVLNDARIDVRTN